jgi:hypothetical protein
MEINTFITLLRLLLGSENNEVVFSFRSVLRLLPEEEEVRCYLLSERPHESGSDVYCTSQPELQKDEVVKIRHA